MMRFKKEQKKDAGLTLCFVEFQLKFILQFCFLIQLFQDYFVLLKKVSRVFFGLTEFLLKRKVDLMSLL